MAGLLWLKTRIHILKTLPRSFSCRSQLPLSKVGGFFSNMFKAEIQKFKLSPLPNIINLSILWNGHKQCIALGHYSEKYIFARWAHDLFGHLNLFWRKKLLFMKMCKWKLDQVHLACLTHLWIRCCVLVLIFLGCNSLSFQFPCC